MSVLVPPMRAVREKLGLATRCPVGWFVDPAIPAWWRLDLDGWVAPLPRPEHPHLRSSVAALPMVRGAR